MQWKDAHHHWSSGKCKKNRSEVSTTSSHQGLRLQTDNAKRAGTRGNGKCTTALGETAQLFGALNPMSQQPTHRHLQKKRKYTPTQTGTWISHQLCMSQPQFENNSNIHQRVNRLVYPHNRYYPTTGRATRTHGPWVTLTHNQMLSRRSQTQASIHHDDI